MAPPLLYDLSSVDLNKVVYGIDDIRAINPHRFEFEQLSAIAHVDYEKTTIVGVRHIRDDEFWVRGHIPGRPLFPGVLMIESAAQLCSFMTRKVMPDLGFVGFAKCDETRFRGVITPPATMYMIALMTDMNRRRCVAKCQGVVNGTLVFESVITGMPV